MLSFFMVNYSNRSEMISMNSSPLSAFQRRWRECSWFEVSRNVIFHVHIKEIVFFIFICGHPDFSRIECKTGYEGSG